jgi:hypothetical protein
MGDQGIFGLRYYTKSFTRHLPLGLRSGQVDRPRQLFMAGQLAQQLSRLMLNRGGQCSSPALVNAY